MLRRKAECVGSGTPVPNLSHLIILHYAKRVSFFPSFFLFIATLINGCPVNGWHNTSTINCGDQAVSHPTTAQPFLAPPIICLSPVCVLTLQTHNSSQVVDSELTLQNVASFGSYQRWKYIKCFERNANFYFNLKAWNRRAILTNWILNSLSFELYLSIFRQFVQFLGKRGVLGPILYYLCHTHVDVC